MTKLRQQSFLANMQHDTNLLKSKMGYERAPVGMRWDALHDILHPYGLASDSRHS